MVLKNLIEYPPHLISTIIDRLFLFISSFTISFSFTYYGSNFTVWIQNLEMRFSTTIQLGNNALYFYTTVQNESGHMF